MKTIATKRHKRLIELLTDERKAHGLRQDGLAHALRKQQVWVSRIESGERRIDVVEFLMLAEAIGFDPFIILAKIQEIEPDKPLRSAISPPTKKRRPKSPPNKKRRRRPRDRQ